jgi:hypothetical protein
MNAPVPARTDAFKAEAGTVSNSWVKMRCEMQTIELNEAAIIIGGESGAGYCNPGTYTLDPGKYADNNIAETIEGFVSGVVKGFSENL